MKKIISSALVGVMALSMIPTALATTDYSNGTQVIYNATASEQYTVTVPAQLAPGGSGDVVAQGTWGSDRKLVVTADETVTLANNINANDTKTLDIGFAGIELAGSNTAAVSATEAVGVADIENALFGTWSGTFYYDVEMVDAVEMISATFAGRTLTAEKGMTWEEWVGSKYHDKFLEDCGDDVKYIPELSIDSQGYVVADNGLSEDYVYADTTITKAADKIIIGADYTRGLPEDRD